MNVSHQSLETVTTTSGRSSKRLGRRGDGEPLEAIGLGAFARAIGTSPEPILAVVATMLCGVAGPDAWLQAPWGHRRVPKLDLVTLKSDVAIQRAVDALTEPLHLMNRRLAQNMGRYDPNVIDLLTSGPFSSSAAMKHADAEMKEKSLRLHAVSLLKASEAVLMGDLAFDPVNQRMEAMKYPQFLIRSADCLGLRPRVEECHLSCALVIKPALALDPGTTLLTKFVNSFGALLDGVAIGNGSTGRAQRRDPSLTAKVHAIISLSEEELGALHGMHRDLAIRFMGLDSGLRGPARAGDGNASACFFETFQATVEEVLNLRRNGRALMIRFPEANLKRFENELSSYEAELDNVPSNPCPWARGLPLVLYWTLALLTRPNGSKVNGDEMISAAFSVARRLTESSNRLVSGIGNERLLEEQMRLAGRIVEEVAKRAPLSFWDLARSFNNQKKSRFEPVIAALVDCQILERDDQKRLKLGNADFKEVGELARRILLEYLE